MAGQGRQVTLVDLDIVEPCYTLRPIQDELERLGVRVIAWSTRETTGLGETGTPLKPAARWALRRPGDIIFDVGYGVEGSKTLNLVEGVGQESSFRVLAVINASRPMTATVEDIVDHVRAMGRIDGLINNTHLAEETTMEVVQEGARIVSEAARILGIPVVATTAVEPIAKQIGPRDGWEIPVRALRRFMPRSFW
ncbi:hypothetical protein [Desulforudis sp. DRI-14]|uniref:hypothetical protein n=1 Tax=Desulforudis sp. DRI-14 TaxID=3459793 RepID=UPI004042AE7F